MSKRFVLLTACVALLSPSLARAELSSVPLSEISMKGLGGEQLTVRASAFRLLSVNLVVKGKRWAFPSSALDMPFRPGTNKTVLYADGHFDSKGVHHDAYLVVIEGGIEGASGAMTSGEASFAFQDGRLVERALTVTEEGVPSDVVRVKF